MVVMGAGYYVLLYVLCIFIALIVMFVLRIVFHGVLFTGSWLQCLDVGFFTNF